MKHRGIVTGTKGMVSSAHTLISASGLKVLEEGGNAMDAAVTMALTAGVVLPDMCGLGGDAFVLYYDAKTKKITAINGSGPAPANATIEYYKTHGYRRMPGDGILSITVPGACDTYFTCLDKFGTISFERACQDAITLAQEGVPVSEKVVRHMHTDLAKMKKHPALEKMWLKDGAPYGFAEAVRQPEHAAFLKRVCQLGRDGFYCGEIADQIVQWSHANGGLFEKEDFSNYHCEITEPISVGYREYTVWQSPPVSQGIIHLEEMAILNHLDIQKYGPETAEAVHCMVEAKKIAFMERAELFGDPAFVHNPIEHVLSDAHTKMMADKIRMDSCLREKDLPHDEGHTTSMIAVDADGNAVSFITSISATWGSGEIVDGTGMLMNNRAAQFSLEEGHPNCLVPGKRTMHTLNTWLVTDSNGNIRYVGNTPGGDNQPQWNMQVLCNLIDFKMDVQTALEHAKWTDMARLGENGELNHILKIESQIGEEQLQKLEKMGHVLQVIDPFTCSGASQVIEVRKDGIRLGGSDPRADGCALAQI